MTSQFRSALALICFAGAVSAATSGSTSATPLPKLTGPVPVTADSAPLLSVTRVFTPLDLKKAGYVEEEIAITTAKRSYAFAVGTAHTTTREELDGTIEALARDAGADIRTGMLFRSLERRPEGIVVEYAA